VSEAKDRCKWEPDRQVNVLYGPYGGPQSHREHRLWQAGTPAAPGEVCQLGRPFELVVPPLARQGGVYLWYGPLAPQ
jgi:hypothetical protein